MKIQARFLAHVLIISTSFLLFYCYMWPTYLILPSFNTISTRYGNLIIEQTRIYWGV